jgi:hypothetical protein
MELPVDVTLPFLAYGIFRPDQIAFFQLADLVADIVDPVPVPGRFLVRDGLPIIDSTAPGVSDVDGSLMHFRPRSEILAYERISDMEPDAQYRWDTVGLDVGLANILVARQPSRGSDTWDFESHEAWDGWRDPVFTEALEVVEEMLRSSRDFNPGDLRPTFRLQMAYLLLWSSIERYLSLRYHLGPKNDSSRLTTSGLVRKLSEEVAFTDALRRLVTRTDRIYRADNPDAGEVLDPTNPKKSLGYYYQVRSNITHRGKGVVRDHRTLVKALRELLSIFQAVLGEAKAEAERLAASF